jgi:hypothetical protein
MRCPYVRIAIRGGARDEGIDHGRGISGDGAGDVDYGRSCRFWAFHREDDARMMVQFLVK